MKNIFKKKKMKDKNILLHILLLIIVTCSYITGPVFWKKKKN